MDIVFDRIVEFSAVLGLFLINPGSRGFLCIMMLGSMFICITSFLVVGIFMSNDGEKGFHYSVGLMERPEAFIFFILMILFPVWFDVFSVLFVVLVFYTAIERIYRFTIIVKWSAKE